MKTKPIGTVLGTRSVDGEHEVAVVQYLDEGGQPGYECGCKGGNYFADGCGTDTRHFQGIDGLEFLTFFELVIVPRQAGHLRGGERRGPRSWARDWIYLPEQIRRGSIRWVGIQSDHIGRFVAIIYRSEKCRLYPEIILAGLPSGASSSCPVM